MLIAEDLQTRAINTIRFLSADAVQKANSGHPGLPMGDAAIAYTIWTQHLRFNPVNPHWFNRDRFILSGGHGSMLLYSLLYLSGYDLSLDDLKAFRQWGSRTPGHPESFLTPGVEVTTGPLGQGFANGIGMAIAGKHLAAEFDRPGHVILDHTIYGIVTDGDLMEGISHEAASWAGHLRLGNVIYMYDNNHVSIDGSTDLAFTEDRAERFRAYHWDVRVVENGNDVDAIDAAIQEAKQDPRPSLIVCNTIIGYGLPHKQGTSEAHGEAPGDAELNAAKLDLDWPVEPRFFVPEDVLDFYRQAVPRGNQLEAEWNQRLDAYRQTYPAEAADLERRMRGELPNGWDANLPSFPADAKGMATRVSSGKVIQSLAKAIPELIGGSADLTPSTKTYIESSGNFEAESYQERNFHFGVREHGMGGAVNGMAANGGVIPFGATFLVFSDYMRPSVRLSALSHLGSIWVYTHDSIGLGEDGPTHQPVEHYAALRAIPGLVTIRPGDANEVTEAWKVAIRRRTGPTALLLTRQNVPTLDRSKFAPAEGLQRGAYVLADLGDGKPNIILIATGSEVSLIVGAGQILAGEGVNVRLVSFPSWELFESQDAAYCQSVLPADIPLRLAVESGVTQGWDRYVGPRGAILGLNHYGASAPYLDAYKHLGFTVDNVVLQARKVLEGK